jgi:hypothetical protein
MISRCRWRKSPSAGGVSGGVERKNLQEVPMGRESKKFRADFALLSSVSGSLRKPNKISRGVLAASRPFPALFIPSERRRWGSRWGEA